MITIDHLSFGYSKRKSRVFNDFSLNLQEGNVYGLLGKNGAGKSTLLYLMTGLLTPAAGEVRLNDVNVRRRLPETLSDFYFIPEEFDLPDYSLEKYVRLHAPFYPKFDHENLRSNLQMFGMTESLKLGELSMGQKKKVLFCFALATRTSWLIMDEPTNGMDIPGKSQFRKLLIREMNEQRGAIISTHQVKDVEQLLDHIVIIEKGKALVDASASDICRKLYFTPSANEEEAQQAYFAQPSPHGYSAMLSNPDGRESELDIELLFNGALAHPKKLGQLLNPQK